MEDICMKVLLFVSFVCLEANATNCKVFKSNFHVVCECSSLNMTAVTPRECPNGTTIGLLDNNNFSILPNNSFCWMVELRELSIRSSNIFKIEPLAFLCLSKLQKLDLYGNNLGHLPDGLFKPIKELLFLNIDANSEFLQYPDTSLQDLVNLHELHIFGIDGQTFGSGFASLKNLNTLILGSIEQPCAYTVLYNQTFSNFQNVPLRTISIHCMVARVDISTFFPLQNVSSLDMKNNRNMRLSNVIPSLYVYNDRTLELLDLSSDFSRKDEHTLTADLMKYIGNICVKDLRFARNHLQKIVLEQFKYKECVQKLDFSGHAISQYTIGLLNLVFFNFPNLKSLNASSNRQMETKPFRANYPIFVLVPKKLETFDISYLNSRWTNFPNVMLKNATNLKTLNISYIGFSDCLGHVDGFSHLETLSMSGLHCSALNIKLLHGLYRLRTLIISNSDLNQGLNKDVNGDFFRDLSKLEHLDISNNRLDSLHADLLSSQRLTLKAINLELNNFVAQPFDIQYFSRLSEINLKGNEIRFLYTESLKSFDSLNKRLIDGKLKLLLAGNPLQCNCESIEFVEWLFSTNVELDKNSNYTCEYIDGSLKSTQIVYDRMIDLKSHCLSRFWLVLSVICSTIFVVILIAVSVTYKYRVNLHYFCLVMRRMYRHYRKLEEDTSNYKFDAFVVYGIADVLWVKTKLVKYLEEKMEFKLCVHQRDFLAGRYIHDNIVDAICDSKKVIIVMTRNYLNSQWGQFEIDMAYMHMYQRNTDMIILIMLEDFPIEQMPDVLKRVWSRVTCLEAYNDDIRAGVPNEDNVFWKSLVESMN